MMSMSSSAEHWRQRLYESLPANLKTWAQAGTRAHLLKQVNCVLMVHDDRLYDLSNGAWRSLQQGIESAMVDGLAAAARELLAHGTEPRRVLLLLPSSHFIATAVTMPHRFQPARSSPRSIVAHIGPTNSGNAMRGKRRC